MEAPPLIERQTLGFAKLVDCRPRYGPKGEANRPARGQLPKSPVKKLQAQGQDWLVFQPVGKRRALGLGNGCHHALVLAVDELVHEAVDQFFASASSPRAWKMSMP